MSSGESILVVEDERPLRELYRRELATLGCRVESAESGDEALTKLKDATFDLVLTDLKMPGSVDGAELVARVKADRPSTDVIVLTGSPTLETAIRTMKDGAADYLTKPFTAEQLQVVVAKCLLNRRIRAELEHEKSLRAELEAAYAELRKVQKLQDAFMARVSHELRTPLAIASGRLFIMDSKAQGADKENVAKARKALGQLENVVADLLTFSELLKDRHDLKLEPVDVTKMMESLLEEHAVLFERKEIEVRNELKEGLTAKADRELLRTALRHLVTNAALFNSFRGFARFSGLVNSGTLHLEFENSGMDLPSEQADRIFDSFYQVAEALTREVGGLGLGLAIVRRIVQNHGGSIRAAPREGGGAKFNLDLSAG